MAAPAQIDAGSVAVDEGDLPRTVDCCFAEEHADLYRVKVVVAGCTCYSGSQDL